MKKYLISILILLGIGLLVFAATKNNQDEDYVSKLPKTNLLSSKRTLPTSIHSYNYSSHKGNRKKDAVTAVLKVKSQEKLMVSFDTPPHEYALTVKSTKTIQDVHRNVAENSFIAPKEKGVYEGTILARWYDKGTIEYKFRLEVI